MDTQTLIALAAVLVPSIGVILSWLWKHSTRLTAVEVRLDGAEDNAVEDRRRAESFYQDIRASLIRIEDKIDRKADR
ncbi:MAG TPA: hypothetical protein VFH59_09855 [Frateuria sp.]|uniref:hypothetical protein n=1 Tax=Frateuria sp. TaxID=2211372 RepID=UPI002D80265B|nr:hypothetical protein [Frateuria sp.]HET6805731.1 hypothetical protein [Frateuria sp.]